MKNRKILAGPYLFWAMYLIIIPLLMILYYGLTDKNGSFTLNNLSQMTTPENLKALGLALLLSFYQHFNLLSPRLSTGYDSCREKMESDKFYRTDIHSSDVDEFLLRTLLAADTFENRSLSM